MLKFNEMPLLETILKNVLDAGYETPTPIQAQAIPSLLEGKDLLGIAQTGTGKTAAFTLPMLQKLAYRDFSLTPLEPRSLILAPTRELASQIKEQLDKYGKDLKIKSAVIFGGVGQAAQVAALRGGLDIVIATPGRLLDLMNQGHCRLNKVEIFVLDEADRMLDMGFINDIKKVIAKLPEKRHTMLFSATMPNEIVGIANRILKSPVRVEVTPASTTVEKIDQRVIFVQKAHKYQLLRQILGQEGVELTLVFTRTKHGANKIVDYLAMHKIQSAAIHGNKSQSAREAALDNFKKGKIKVLVATDIAARGIDVAGVSHVVNYDLPVEAESYVHRIGRTARAGKEGDAISFCDESERDALSRIQKLIGLKLPVETFVGVAEQSVKDSRPERPYRDPRARPRNDQPRQSNSSNDQRPAQEPRRDSRSQEPKRNQRPDEPRREFQKAQPRPGAKPGQGQEENKPAKPPKVGFRFRNKK
jgi:ATP-dependent RNA helicase RhlE